MSKKFKIRLSAFVFWTCLSLAQTSPIQRYVRVMREVYPEIEPEKVEGSLPQVCVVGDVVYEAEEPVPADQSCLKCKCQPPGVHCETIRCLKKPGCRAIHKPNKCCPDYQCECEHKGRTYGNGERLESKPGGECQVCYCRGGEVQCTEVSCYIRTDCVGKTVPGQCCPKYDHCPAIEAVSGKISPKLDVDEPEITTKAFIDPAINASAENEIGETTLSFEKADNFFSVEATTLVSIPKLNTKDQFTQTEKLDTSNIPRITIHEIIPDIKEIPITEPPKQDNTSNLPGKLLVEEKVPIASDGNLEENHANDVEDSALESSELSEVFQHPSPVLKIGNDLYVVNEGELVPEKDASTPSPVFTIIGAEGLQRGDIESNEQHEISKEYDTIPTDSPIGASAVTARSPSDERKHIINESDKNKYDPEPTEINRLLDVSLISSQNIGEDMITKLNQKESAPTTSETTLKADDNATIDVAVQLAASNFDEQNKEQNQNSENKSDTFPLLEATATTKKSIEDEQKLKIEEIVQLENPAYPPIPDIMSQQGAEYIDHSDVVDNTSKDTLDNIVESSTVDAKILPEILPFRRNNTGSENATNTSWLKSDDSQSLVNEKAALPEEILKQVAPSDLEASTDMIPITSEESDLQGKQRSLNLQTDVPVEGFRDEDLLKYGTIVERDPLVENQVKKLADEEDVLGSFVSVSQEKTRSTETLENSSADISGENTTPKTVSHTSLLSSNEDASIENYHQDTKEMSSEEDQSSSNYNKSRSDVEIIDPALMTLNTNTNLTHEENSKEYAQKPKDRVEKRTISQEYDPESEKIFQELDTELHLLDNDRVSTKSDEEEKREAEIIFKELLDEVNSSTSKAPKELGKGTDSEVLQRVSDAIAKFQLKEARQSLDAGILGILRDFFTSQYKSYKDI